jgi:(p)ppGpp synthase/HD superfamily hydrolase
MEDEQMDESKIFDAIEFAAKAHRDHFRKDSKIPYMAHLMGVCKILIQYEAPTHVVVAGILHDTIEDRGITGEQIENAFGEDVARIVESVTEPPKREPWEYRKKHTIELMRTAP